MADEQIEFQNGAIGQVFNLEENSVGVAILGNYLEIKEGDEVRRTGQLLSVPCGDEATRYRTRIARFKQRENDVHSPALREQRKQRKQRQGLYFAGSL